MDGGFYEMHYHPICLLNERCIEQMRIVKIGNFLAGWCYVFYLPVADEVAKEFLNCGTLWVGAKKY